MDAYGDYMMRLAEARLSDLRREARDDRLARVRRAAGRSVREGASRWRWLRLPPRGTQAGPAGGVVAPPGRRVSEAAETTRPGRAWEDAA